MADLNLSHNPKITVLNYLIIPIDYQLLMIFTVDGDFRVYGGGWDGVHIRIPQTEKKTLGFLLSAGPLIPVMPGISR